MSEPRTGLFVRIPREQAEQLAQAAVRLGKSKQEIVAGLLSSELDLVVGRAEVASGDSVLTLGEAAELLRVAAATIEQRAEARDLPGRCLAGEWRFSRAALLAWLAGSDGGRSGMGFGR